MEHAQPFSGDKKVGQSILHHAEQTFIRWAVPRVPPWIETTHLTLATIPICFAIVGFSFLATHLSIAWLWGTVVMIALQWLTDSLDGSVGRFRKTGLVKWGYFMDHLLDYFFLCSIVISYMLLLPDNSKWLMFGVFSLFAGFMVNSFLMMAATNEFKITHLGIGPTEIRILFIMIDVLIITFGKTHMAFALPWVLLAAFLGLVWVIYNEQKILWKIDMDAKAKQSQM